MKKRKFLYVRLIFLLGIVLVGCNINQDEEVDDITINLTTENNSIYVGTEQTIAFETNDELGVSFTSSDDSIVTVDENGKFTAVGVGEATIKITSKTDPTIYKEFVLTVTLEESDYTLAVGMKADLGYKASEGYSFESSNQYISFINEEGFLVGNLNGTATINVFKNETLIRVINVDVLMKVRTITLSGPKTIYYNDLVKLDVLILPGTAYPEVEFIVEDETILEVDLEGNVKPLKAGTTKVTVRSLQDDLTQTEMMVTVKPVVLVKNELADFKLGTYEFKVEESLFDNIEDALAVATEDTKILLHNYDGTLAETINKGILIEGDNANLSEALTIDTTEKVTLSNINFIENGSIEALGNVDLTLNEINVLASTKETLINLENVNNFVLTNSNFSGSASTAIDLNNVVNSASVYLSDNTFNSLNEAVVINNVGVLNDDASIKLYYNNFDNVVTPLTINLDEVNASTNAELYARFNDVTNFTKAINHQGPQVFEYTFNYWGEFNLNNFDNVDEAMLLGYYQKAGDILEKSKYNPNVPIIVELINVPEQIMLGDSYELEFMTLPYTANPERYYIAVDDARIVNLENNKTLKPFRSGLLGLSIGSYADLTGTTVKHLIDLTTEPGMTFTMSKETAGFTVGETFNVIATPFPYNLVGESVNYSTSDSNIATVDSNGNVTIVGVGDFDVIATLATDASVEQRLPLTSYSSLDKNNLLDFYIMSQINYSKVFDMTFHGTEIATGKLSEPVTRVLVDDIPRFEDIIPVTPGFRPGVKFNSQLAEPFKLNDDNVVWVVIHDTGNSSVGGGARMHANYLMNQVLNNGRAASWHYTVDPKEIFQHMPLDEVAYHAGDGSSLPGIGKESPSLGGGNRNGIGIEMSIQRDGDQFRTWQNTARLSAELLDNYNLPLSHVKYHNDFSGKECPQTLRRAGLVWLFEEYVANEYHLRKTFGASPNVQIISKNPEILSNTGHIVNIPNHTTVVEYDIVVNNGGVTQTQTVRTLVEGLYR